MNQLAGLNDLFVERGGDGKDFWRSIPAQRHRPGPGCANLPADIRAEAFGLKPGWFAIARISPVAGVEHNDAAGFRARCPQSLSQFFFGKILNFLLSVRDEIAAGARFCRPICPTGCSIRYLDRDYPSRLPQMPSPLPRRVALYFSSSPSSPSWSRPVKPRICAPTSSIGVIAPVFLGLMPTPRSFSSLSCCRSSVPLFREKFVV